MVFDDVYILRVMSLSRVSMGFYFRYQQLVYLRASLEPSSHPY